METIEIRNSKSKWFYCALVSLIFIGGCWFIIAESEYALFAWILGWLPILCLIVSVWQILARFIPEFKKEQDLGNNWRGILVELR